MARLVVFGLGPMRWESSTRLFALALRSWHFAHTLARAGHEVLLFSLRGFAYEGWPSDKITHIRRGRVSVWSISEHLCHERPEWIRSRIADFEPDAIVGVNRDPAAIAVNFADNLPFWADINGDPMAEAQVKASALGGDWNINEWYRKFGPVLHRADRFSTCSCAQRAALIGQLGMHGRLTAKNDGYEFVSAVPNSIDDDELEALGHIQRQPRKVDDKFVLLWSGGYNTWTDPDVLFGALELAMKRAPALQFVSTGGGIAGHHVDSYQRFEERIRGSRYHDRFELAGWVQTAELPAYYAGAHAAILVDRFSYEGVLGARTRMLDWLAAALPIVTTRLSEVSIELEQAEIALTAPCGNASALADAILSLYRDPTGARERGERGRAYARERLRAQLQLSALLEWASAPVRAPDYEHHVELAWSPGARTILRQQASLVREQLRERGARDTIAQAGRFALRRLKNSAGQVAERLGLTETPVTALEAPAPDAPPIEAPRLAAFQWRDRFAELREQPHLTVLILVDSETPPHIVSWTCDQVRTQYFDAWSAVLAQTGPLRPELEAELRTQEKALAERGNLVERIDARSVDLSKHRLLAEAEWVLLLPSGSLLRPDALAELAWEAREHAADIVYADEQHVDETNVPMPPRRKPGWSPELILARSYLGRAVLIKSSRLDIDRERVGDWPHEALVYDAVLRASDRPCHVVQLPYVLAQTWSPQHAAETKLVRHEQQVARAELEALRNALWRRGSEAEALRGPRPGIARVRWPVPKERPLVVVLGIGPDAQLERCRESIAKHQVEIVVARPRSGGIRLAALSDDAKYFVIVDPHLEASHGDWLGALLEQAARPDVAAVCPKLLHPNGATAWRGSLSGADDWVDDTVHEIGELSPLCFAAPRERIGQLEILVDESQRRSSLTLHAEAWQRSGYRLLYTPFAFFYTHAENGQHRPARTAGAKIEGQAARPSSSR